MSQPKSLIRFIKLPKILDDCDLVFAQNPHHIPFVIKRVYYIFKADTKLPRGYHAHRQTRQVIFCIQGTIKLTLDDGRKKQTTTLKEPNIGVFIDKMIWHMMQEFKVDTILLVLASKVFNEEDYIRDYGQFKKEANQIR